MSMQEPRHDALTAGYNFKRLGQTIFPNDVFTKEYILLPQFLAAKISEYVGSDVTGTTKAGRLQFYLRYNVFNIVLLLMYLAACDSLQFYLTINICSYLLNILSFTRAGGL
ncbi:hypothetical protein C8R44DRAFT_751904 [Mycena epipterygia]|nr:hypothetical protein C8R44DRAFT_751904 [Mycena epipterygia]